jgi:hypothetical protein
LTSDIRPDEGSDADRSRMAFKAIRNPRMTIRRMATIRRIDREFIGDQRGVEVGRGNGWCRDVLVRTGKCSTFHEGHFG